MALPDRGARRRLRKAFKQRDQAGLDELRQQDEQTLAQTGIRRQYSVRQLKAPAPPVPFDTPEAAPLDGVQDEAPRLRLERSCYICKAKYDRVHEFYDALCPECAELNWTKRHQTDRPDRPVRDGHRRPR